MDGLFVALVDDEDGLPVLPTFDDEPFTHVVQVSCTLVAGRTQVVDTDIVPYLTRKWCDEHIER
jgi:hypothetical protein